MFNSIFINGNDVGYVLIAIGVAILTGIAYSFILSLRLRSTKGLFISLALLPSIVALSFIVLNVLITNTTVTAITSVAVAMVAMGLIRFRSANGRAEEMVLLFASVASGAAFGMGFIAYGVIGLLVIAGIYDLLSFLPIFTNKRFKAEKLLKITIPESLDYTDVFKETFDHFLRVNELVEVKTTGMGSMFRLSYRIILKNPKEEKELIDELRTKNGNLEISILPYVEPTTL